MPLPVPILAGAISGGADVLSQGINAVTQSAANRRQWKHQKEMYNWQRRDALSDWNMQNMYDSPAEQMKRLKAGGLNPNLVYGQGAQAGSPAPVKQSSQGSNQQTAPQIDLGGIGQMFAMMYDLTKQSVETNKLQAQNDLVMQQLETEKLKRWSMRVKGFKDIASTEGITWDTKLKEGGYLSSLEALRLKNRKTEADIAFTINQQDLNTAKTATNIEQMLQQIAESKARTENIKLSRGEINARIYKLRASGALDELEHKWLTERGSSTHDPMWQRYLGVAIGAILNKFGIDMQEWEKKDTENKMSGKQKNDKYMGPGWKY